MVGPIRAPARSCPPGCALGAVGRSVSPPLWLAAHHRHGGLCSGATPPRRYPGAGDGRQPLDLAHAAEIWQDQTFVTFRRHALAKPLRRVVMRDGAVSKAQAEPLYPSLR